MEIILNLTTWLVGLVGILGIIGLLPLLVTGIVFLVKAGNEEDEVKAKKSKKRGIWFMVSPMLMIAGALIVNVILAFIKTMIGI
ncbi:hypothetical protein ACFL16_03425 [Patescibacteria group bacterium]